MSRKVVRNAGGTGTSGEVRRVEVAGVTFANSDGVTEEQDA